MRFTIVFSRKRAQAYSGAAMTDYTSAERQARFRARRDARLAEAARLKLEWANERERACRAEADLGSLRAAVYAIGMDPDQLVAEYLRDLGL